MDDDLRALEREARTTNDPALIKKLQEERSRVGFSASDAEYLTKYIDICNKFVNRALPLGDEYPRTEHPPNSALGQLAGLNDQYQFQVCSGTIKQNIVASMLAGYEGSDGWAKSDICW